MIPIEDENPTYSRAWVVYILILLNVLFFLLEVALVVEGNFEAIIYDYVAVPKEIVRGQALHTLFTSMFLHVGFMHLAGNILFLYIFGNNIEDVLGKRRFILFYLISGVAASLFQVMVDPDSEIPMLGASGAIAGVLGAYFYIYPKANIKSVLVIGFPFNVFYHLYRGFARIPAYILIGFWLLVQLFPGFLSLQNGITGGIAYFAHIGGFITGIVLIRHISTDLDIARRKQQIHEGICARKIEKKRKAMKKLKEAKRQADNSNLHLLLKSLAKTDGIKLKEAAEKLDLDEEKIQDYVECLLEGGYAVLVDDSPNPGLQPTKKCITEYG